jgi:hypothetical protein
LSSKSTCHKLTTLCCYSDLLPYRFTYIVIPICLFCHIVLPILSFQLVHVHWLAYMITILSPFPNTHLERLFHFEHIDLKGWPHNWHGYHAVEWYVHPSLGFGMNRMPFQHLNCLDLMLLLDMKDFLIFSCIDYLQLHRRPRGQANLLSRQGHDGV